MINSSASSSIINSWQHRLVTHFLFQLSSHIAWLCSFFCLKLLFAATRGYFYIFYNCLVSKNSFFVSKLLFAATRGYFYIFYNCLVSKNFAMPQIFVDFFVFFSSGFFRVFFSLSRVRNVFRVVFMCVLHGPMRNLLTEANIFTVEFV